MSIIPIRCFTCGKVIANKWEKYITYEDKTLAFKELKIEKICCKRMFLTNIDNFDIISQYNLNFDNISLKTERSNNIIHNAR